MGSVRKNWNWVEGSGAVICMILVQIFATGLQLLSKIILNQGTFVYALMAYRNIVGALCVAPFAFFFERGEVKKLNWSIGFWLFTNALTGITMAMGFFYYGLRDTTATYATNFLNLIPIVTFVFSTVVRMEKLRLGTKAGKVKTLGAIVCLAGALTISLYKGKSFHINFLHKSTDHHPMVTNEGKHNWARGTVFLVISILSYATWFLVQVKLFILFPYKYWATMLTCIIASVQATVVGVCLDRNKGSWSLGWNLQLLTIIYSGSLATAATFCLISLVVRRKGPTYPSMFNPLALMLVAIIGACFLGDAVTVGSLVGMCLIIVGLYSFLWGKNKELKSMAPSEASMVVKTECAAAVVTPTSVSPLNDDNIITAPVEEDHHVLNPIKQRDVLEV